MLSADFCLSKAEECELAAQKTTSPDLRLEWLRIANEWRVAAFHAEALAGSPLSVSSVQPRQPDGSARARLVEPHPFGWDCEARAAEAARLAKLARDAAVRADLERIRSIWLRLAEAPRRPLREIMRERRAERLRAHLDRR